MSESSSDKAAMWKGFFVASLTIPFLGSLYLLQQKRLKSKTAGKKAAVVMAGCGYLDGSETTESLAVLVTLAELGIEAQVFAPDASQTDVMDHQSSRALGTLLILSLIWFECCCN